MFFDMFIIPWLYIHTYNLHPNSSGQAIDLFLTPSVFTSRFQLFPFPFDDPPPFPFSFDDPPPFPVPFDDAPPFPFDDPSPFPCPFDDSSRLVFPFDASVLSGSINVPSTYASFVIGVLPVYEDFYKIVVIVRFKIKFVI